MIKMTEKTTRHQDNKKLSVPLIKQIMKKRYRYDFVKIFRPLEKELMSVIFYNPQHSLRRRRSSSSSVYSASFYCIGMRIKS